MTYDEKTTFVQFLYQGVYQLVCALSIARINNCDKDTIRGLEAMISDQEGFIKEVNK